MSEELPHADFIRYEKNKALKTSNSGILTNSVVTSTELGCLSGVTGPIQEQINKQLDQAKSDSAELIKSAFIKLQDESSKKLEELDKNLSTKIDATYETIEKNKSESMSQIYEQINDITKLMISKISNVQVNEGEIKMAVEKIRQKVIH